eukprot:1054444-Pelagomonas_calceolata.AAC.4
MSRAGAVAVHRPQQNSPVPSSAAKPRSLNTSVPQTHAVSTSSHHRWWGSAQPAATFTCAIICSASG